MIKKIYKIKLLIICLNLGLIFNLSKTNSVTTATNQNNLSYTNTEKEKSTINIAKTDEEIQTTKLKTIVQSTETIRENIHNLQMNLDVKNVPNQQLISNALYIINQINDEFEKNLASNSFMQQELLLNNLNKEIADAIKNVQKLLLQEKQNSQLKPNQNKTLEIEIKPINTQNLKQNIANELEKITVNCDEIKHFINGIKQNNFKNNEIENEKVVHYFNSIINEFEQINNYLNDFLNQNNKTTIEKFKENFNSLKIYFINKTSEILNLTENSNFDKGIKKINEEISKNLKDHVNKLNELILGKKMKKINQQIQIINKDLQMLKQELISVQEDITSQNLINNQNDSKHKIEMNISNYPKNYQTMLNIPHNVKNTIVYNQKLYKIQYMLNFIIKLCTVLHKERDNDALLITKIKKIKTVYDEIKKACSDIFTCEENIDTDSTEKDFKTSLNSYLRLSDAAMDIINVDIFLNLKYRDAKLLKTLLEKGLSSVIISFDSTLKLITDKINSNNKQNHMKNYFNFQKNEQNIKKLQQYTSNIYKKIKESFIIFNILSEFYEEKSYESSKTEIDKVMAPIENLKLIFKCFNIIVNDLNCLNKLINDRKIESDFNLIKIDSMYNQINNLVTVLNTWDKFIKNNKYIELFKIVNQIEVNLKSENTNICYFKDLTQKKKQALKRNIKDLASICNNHNIKLEELDEFIKAFAAKADLNFENLINDLDLQNPNNSNKNIKLSYIKNICKNKIDLMLAAYYQKILKTCNELVDCYSNKDSVLANLDCICQSYISAIEQANSVN